MGTQFCRLTKVAVPALATVLCVVEFIGVAYAVNPIPTVVGPVVPQAVVPGSGAFTLKVYGANFVSGAVVNWNRSPRTTTFMSTRELQAQILASDVAAPTAGYITVANPPPGGGLSSSSYSLVEVHTPTTTIVAKKPHVYLRDVGSQHAILADFNNDGLLDFAADYGFSEIKTFLGNGDGTFGHGSITTYNYYGSGPAAIASGDFNNDGNEDLAFGADPKGPPTQVQVNLGDGTGKFSKSARFGHFQVYPFGIVVGDFNRDGNLDLIAEENVMSVFLGNGDGTFRKGPTNNKAGGDTIVTGDFNGDGKLDLAFLGPRYLEIVLGNGDGTFQEPRLNPVTNPVCNFGPPIFVTDLNADGISDLVFCERDQTNGKIWIMLGRGDGTFKKPVDIPIQNGIYGFTFTVGDFNSDGKTDLLVNYFISDSQTETDLYLGSGDGTFERKKIIKLPGLPFYNPENGILPADLNSDGLMDFIFKAPGEFDVFTQN
jgi:hypothetical protein